MNTKWCLFLNVAAQNVTRIAAPVPARAASQETPRGGKNRAHMWRLLLTAATLAGAADAQITPNTKPPESTYGPRGCAPSTEIISPAHPTLTPLSHYPQAEGQERAVLGGR